MKACIFNHTQNASNQDRQSIYLIHDSLPRQAFSCIHPWKAINQTFCKHGLSLNTDFHRFKRTQANISYDLSRGTAKEVYGALVTVYKHVRVPLLEILIEAKLAATLNTIAKKFPSPASPK